MTDIEIAQKNKMIPIVDVAKKIGITEDSLELYGKYKAKITMEELRSLQKKASDPNNRGKLILTTALTPTPAGEGKSTVSIALGDGLNKIGKKAVIALREPSLGPCFGVKGGACGGGYAQIVPMEDINLHFTGDIHAISIANNLIAALIDNHIKQGNQLQIDPRTISWKRCVDLNDRELRNIVVGMGGVADGMPREDHFCITVASELMAIICLSTSISDLKRRVDSITIGKTFDKRPVKFGELKCTGAIAVLLKDAIKPNLVQTLEKNPVFATYVSNLFISNTMLLIGYSLDDNDFRGIWHIINDRLGGMTQPAYCVVVDASQAEIARYARRNIHVINLPGKKKNYKTILRDFFVEIKEYISAEKDKTVKSKNERINEQLIIPSDNNRLCYISCSMKRIAQLSELLYPILRSNGIMPVRIDDVLMPDDNWIDVAETIIRKSKMAIVDISDKSQNVLFELGYLNAEQKSTLVICEDDVDIDIPSILKNKLIFKYSMNYTEKE